MSAITFATIALLIQVGLLVAILWSRSLSNKSLFKTKGQLQPVRSKNPFFGAHSGLYDLLDRIPLLRRSGTANEFDLVKAMLLVTAPSLLMSLMINRPSPLVALLGVNIIMFLINAVVLAHPALKRLMGSK